MTERQRAGSLPEVGIVEMDPDLMEIFSKYDEDGNGTIDATELEAALIGLGMPCDRTAIASILASFSSTGTLSLEQVRPAPLSRDPWSEPRRPFSAL